MNKEYCIKNPEGRLHYHDHRLWRWKNCENCGKGKVPSNLHSYWHSPKNKGEGGGVDKGLIFTCPNCKQRRIYNPTFDITVII